MFSLIDIILHEVFATGNVGQSHLLVMSENGTELFTNALP